jgi:cytochrome c oxidase subunit II
VALLAACSLGGCARQSPLDPHSAAASAIATLWWVMLAVASIVFLGAVAMLILGYVRRSRPGLPVLGEDESANTRLVVLFGIAIPAVVLIALFVVSDLFVIRQTDAPAADESALTIHVVGHQWFWEVRYPGTQAVTANEIHIPVGKPVRIVGTTADVIHSFWVPELNRKIDLIPGRQNSTLLEADQASVYRGQCAEFCGLQHANMALSVVAEPQRAYNAWLHNMAKPARPPASAAASAGKQVFMSSQCQSCHAIRGTPATGTVGPDLTHLATRQTLAAETIPNTHPWLRRWIANPQAIKPGNVMPDLGVSGHRLQDVVAYLRGLR